MKPYFVKLIDGFRHICKMSDLGEDFSFKVIGEVSSNAIWVKDEDTLELEDLGWMCDDGSGKIISFTELKTLFESYDEPDKEFDDIRNAIIAICCPVCKNFSLKILKYEMAYSTKSYF